MNIVFRFALIHALSLVLCGATQQVIMAVEGESNTTFALVPLIGCILPITLAFVIAISRRRSARIIDRTAMALLAFALVFGVVVYVAGVNSRSPGIGGNIGYGVAMLVDFYFLLPAALAVPVHWFLLRRVANTFS